MHQSPKLHEHNFKTVNGLHLSPRLLHPTSPASKNENRKHQETSILTNTAPNTLLPFFFVFIPRTFFLAFTHFCFQISDYRVVTKTPSVGRTSRTSTNNSTNTSRQSSLSRQHTRTPNKLPGEKYPLTANQALGLS